MHFGSVLLSSFHQYLLVSNAPYPTPSSARKVQPRRHRRRSEKAHRSSDRDECIQDPTQEMVRHSFLNSCPLFPPQYKTVRVELTDVFFVTRYTIYKDHITLADYEIHDGMSLEMY